MRGHLFENLIVMELLKRRLNAGKESNLFFYRDSNQNEIDIVVDDSSSVSLIEVKSSMTYSSSFTKALDKADKWFNKPISRKSIVYAGSLEDPDGRIRLINYQHL
jgi:predicted AAA+ superfamily ATPase